MVKTFHADPPVIFCSAQVVDLLVVLPKYYRKFASGITKDSGGITGKLPGITGL